MSNCDQCGKRAHDLETVYCWHTDCDALICYECVKVMAIPDRELYEDDVIREIYVCPKCDRSLE